jgi:hypothetical protein
MEDKNYQPWEEELEASELEQHPIAAIPMAIAAIFGLFIFAILIVRTSLENLFRRSRK